MADSKTMGDTVRNGRLQQRRIEGLLAELVLSALHRFDSECIRQLCSMGKLVELDPGTSVRAQLLGDFLVIEGMLTRSSERHTLGEVDHACTGDVVRAKDRRLGFVQAVAPTKILCLPRGLALRCQQLRSTDPVVRAVGSGPLVIADLA